MGDQLSRNEQYLRDIKLHDHEDGRLIDAEFNTLIVETNNPQAAMLGFIATVDERLAPTMPWGEKFGYQTAKNSCRWFMFRTMWLSDLAPIYRELDESGQLILNGLEQHYRSYEVKLDNLEERPAQF